MRYHFDMAPLIALTILSLPFGWLFSRLVDSKGGGVPPKQPAWRYDVRFYLCLALTILFLFISYSSDASLAWRIGFFLWLYTTAILIIVDATRRVILRDVAILAMISGFFISTSKSGVGTLILSVIVLSAIGVLFYLFGRRRASHTTQPANAMGKGDILLFAAAGAVLPLPLSVYAILAGLVLSVLLTVGLGRGTADNTRSQRIALAPGILFCAVTLWFLLY